MELFPKNHPPPPAPLPFFTSSGYIFFTNLAQSPIIKKGKKLGWLSTILNKFSTEPHPPAQKKFIYFLHKKFFLALVSFLFHLSGASGELALAKKDPDLEFWSP